MDLRELVRTNPEWVVGHNPVTERLNVEKESRRFSIDPLTAYLNAISDEEAEYFHGDIGRYKQAYSWYALCLTRTLQQCSVHRRYDKEIRYHPVNVKYSARQIKIAEKHKTIGPYIELDYQNLIIHACILLDRAITLSRRFLRGNNLPSYTSFTDHKKFLKAKSDSIDRGFHSYTDHLVNSTDWFEVPLKVLRDKYLMHSAERHLVGFGWSTYKQWDVEMHTVIKASHNQGKLLEKIKVINFSPRRLARDIETFLSWYGKYGQTAM